MSIKLMTAITKYGPANSSQRFVLLMIADNAADDGSNAWPSVETLAEKTALSERSVVRALNALVEDGYLERRRRRDKTNMYQIVLDKLAPAPVSDNLSLTVGDNLSLTEVTNCHVGKCQTVTSVSDTVSPDPSLNHPINHPKRGETERANGHAPAAPPPPIVRTVIPDRTVGLPARSYLAEPDPPKSPPARDPAYEKRRLAVGEMMAAITDVTGVSGKLNKADVIPLAEDLVDAGYTPDQLRTHYGREQFAGRWNWYADDWRGKKGERPRLKELRETIAGAVAHNAAPITQKQAGPVDRFLAGLGLSASPATS